jgi:c-di-GMP-related signal transduction protein
MEDIFIARQPIVDRGGSLVAFELLFRSTHGATDSGTVDNTSATAQVLVNAFGEMGIAEVLGIHKGFVNLEAELLHSDLIELLPREQVVLELLETVAIDAKVIARCHELHSKGYVLALDDVVDLTEEIKPLLGIVGVVKLDLMLIDSARLPGLVQKLKQYPIKLLAEKIEDHEQARRCLEMGFDLFQGYHFSRPEMLSGRRTSPSKLALLNVLALMLSDASNTEIEEALKGHADLTYNLLRMVNSAGVGLTTKIRSLRHGLMVLGRQTLRRWVQLMLYASDKGTATVSPLMQLAASRGKFMELVALQAFPEESDYSDYSDRAFMVGMMSLLDALLGEPLPDILSRMGLQDDVEAALLRREGGLGKLLSLCEKIETGDVNEIEKELHEHLDLSIDKLNELQIEALGWANSITR